MPVQSCTQLLDIKDDEFDAVSITFDLKEHNRKHPEKEDDDNNGRDKKDNRHKHEDDGGSKEDSDEDEEDESDSFPQAQFRQEVASALNAKDVR